MTAREKFNKGDLVQFSAEWLNGSVHHKQRLLRVVGFGRESHQVRVYFDGKKTSHTFHMDFIERLAVLTASTEEE